MSQTLRLGSVTFGENNPFEAPNGFESGLGDLGSKQKAVVREFPGGIVMAQLHGVFPKPVEWSGILFGANAMSRSREIQRLCDNEEELTFSYGQWNYQGFVEEYKAIVKSPYEIHYTIIFVPVDANSNGGAVANSQPLAATVLKAQAAAAQQAIAPLAGGTLPNSVQSGITSLNQSINKAVQQAGGSINNVPTSTLQTLQNQIANIQNILQPFIGGLDPILSSAASDLNSSLSILFSAFGAPQSALLTTIQAVNPNLYELASRFYGTPLLYWVIGQANGLADPLPITNGPINLVIPQKPNLPASNEIVVMSDGIPTS